MILAILWMSTLSAYELTQSLNNPAQQASLPPASMCFSHSGLLTAPQFSMLTPTSLTLWVSGFLSSFESQLKCHGFFTLSWTKSTFTLNPSHCLFHTTYHCIQLCCFNVCFPSFYFPPPDNTRSVKTAA